TPGFSRRGCWAVDGRLPARAAAPPDHIRYSHRAMSKAFTSEETPESGPVTRAPPTLAPGEVRYITPEGHAALRESLAKLKDERAAATGLPETERGPVLADLDQKIAFTEATL